VRPRAPRHLRRRRGPRPGRTYGAQRRTAASEDRDDESHRKHAPSPRSPSPANTNHFLAGTFKPVLSTTRRSGSRDRHPESAAKRAAGQTASAAQASAAALKSGVGTLPGSARAERRASAFSSNLSGSRSSPTHSGCTRLEESRGGIEPPTPHSKARSTPSLPVSGHLTWATVTPPRHRPQPNAVTVGKGLRNSHTLCRLSPSLPVLASRPCDPAL